MYRRRGETKIRISKSLEVVYYHPMRSCAPSASGTNIKMDDKVAGQLSDSNRQFDCSVQFISPYSVLIL